VTIAAGLGLSLASAFALNWGWVAQHSAARELPPLSIRQPLRSLRALFGDTGWLVGFVVGLGGWALYVGALALAPLSLVQAVSAGGIGILALLAQRRGEILGRAQWRAVAVSIGGLALLAGSLPGGTANAQQPNAGAIGVFVAASVAVALLAGSFRSAAAFGIASGVLYGTGDVATKAATFAGAWLVLVVVVLAAHGTAFAFLQLGFQRGSALTTAGLATLLTNALPIAAGVMLFHEHVPGGALGAARVAGFGAVVVGAALLTRSEAGAARAARLDHLPPSTARHEALQG
jgi:hypothetical protein